MVATTTMMIRLVFNCNGNNDDNKNGYKMAATVMKTRLVVYFDNNQPMWLLMSVTMMTTKTRLVVNCDNNDEN